MQCRYKSSLWSAQLHSVCRWGEYSNENNMRTIHTVTKNFFNIYIFLLHHLYISIVELPRAQQEFSFNPNFFFSSKFICYPEISPKNLHFFLHFSLASLPFWLFFFIFFFIAFATFSNFLTQHALITKRSLTHLVGSQDARIMNGARLESGKNMANIAFV